MWGGGGVNIRTGLGILTFRHYFLLDPAQRMKARWEDGHRQVDSQVLTAGLGYILYIKLGQTVFTVSFIYFLNIYLFFKCKVLETFTLKILVWPQLSCNQLTDIPILKTKSKSKPATCTSKSMRSTQLSLRNRKQTPDNSPFLNKKNR